MPENQAEEEGRLEELEDKIEEIEGKTQGKNQVEIVSHDLTVKASSEEMPMDELIEVCSGEMENISKRALLGEYQALEEEGLHSRLFGGE